MSQEVYTVERVAERLHLHPKTVLRMIHEGRLRATRIGKAYRILRADLEALAGEVSPAPRATAARATCIVDLTEVSAEAAARLTTVLQASLMTRTARPDPVRLDMVHDPEARTFKVVILGAPADAAALLQILSAVSEGLT